MLSSLFEKRNQKGNPTQNDALYSIVTKKVEAPKIVSKKELQKSMTPQERKQLAKKQKTVIQQDRPEATIFIGNVALSAKHHDLKKHFEKYGKIQKVWFRSVPVEVNKMGRKANLILKKYVEGADAMNAYIRFEDEECAVQALKSNGETLNQLTIRVSPCEQKDNDTQSTVFVGNLSHEIKQQELRNHFTSIGKIISVRVIKSRQTNKGIGIGYVHFSTKQEMRQSISKLNGTELLERKIRVKKAVPTERLEKKEKKIQEKYGKKYKGKGKKVPQNKNSRAIEIRQKSKEIKDNRETFKSQKTKFIRK